VESFYAKSPYAHVGLRVGPRHAKPCTDDVSLTIGQRTTGAGGSILLDLSRVSRFVTWLVGATGEQPDVEGYGARPSGGPLTDPAARPPLVLVDSVGAYANVLTVHALPDGEALVSVTHFATHFENPGGQGAMRVPRADVVRLRDWLATWHLHGWPGVQHGVVASSVPA
jgi:hypothetical protein